MTQIAVDNVLSEKLRQSHIVELVDEDGFVLGSFASFQPRPIDASLIPPLTKEERQRLLNSQGKYSTEEVLAHLRSL